ncbi:MAG: hypothetical protein QG656_2630, partial [Candidatus Hydrogenedentes bacterium]|nr:hypothetical protein [Candidatus Hydrogenedentota bacterium]
MRTLAFIGLAAVAFLATILIAMGMTGNLSKANIARIFKGPEPVVEQAEPVDEAGPLAKALSVRDEELRKRELELEAREQRVATREEELQELRDEIAALQQQVQQSLDGEDTDRE